MRGGSFNLTPNQQASIRFYVLIFVLSFFGWAGLARIIRGEVLSLREREFVLAAKAIGVPTRQVLFKELLPNLVAPIIVYATLIIPQNILFEAALSYLGVGVQPPNASWGQMLAEASGIMKTPEPGLPLDMVRLGRPAVTQQLRNMAGQVLSQPDAAP